MDSTATHQKRKTGQKQQQLLWDSREAKEIIQSLQQLVKDKKDQKEVTDQQQQKQKKQIVRQVLKKAERYLLSLSVISSTQQLEQTKRALRTKIEKLKVEFPFLHRQQVLLPPPLQLHHQFFMGGGGEASPFDIRDVLLPPPTPMPSATMSMPSATMSMPPATMSMPPTHGYGTRGTRRRKSGDELVKDEHEPLQEMYKRLEKEVKQQILKQKQKK